MVALKLIIIGLLSMSSRVFGYSTAANFAKDYFPSRVVQQIVAFGCWKIDAAVKFTRFLMNHNMMVVYVPIREPFDMDRILKVNYYRLGIFVDYDCPRSKIIFEQFSEQRMRYNESYWWLIVSRKASVPKNFFSKLPLNIATEMTFALRKKDSYEFFDVYNPSYNHGGKLNVTFMGTWNYERGLNIVLNQYKYLRRGNLYGLTLNSSVALKHAPEKDFITYLNIPTNRNLDTMHRYNYGLIIQLLDYYNMRLNLKKDSTWGYRSPNGSYDGILGDVIKGLVDISVSPFGYRTDRLDVIEYTVQTMVVTVPFIFRHPQNNELNNAFLTPFEPVVWYWIIVVVVANWLLLFSIAKIEQYYDRREPANTLDTDPASEIGLIVIAAVCQQGLSDGPRMYSGRIIFLFLFFWALLMYQFYSASVVGSLLVEKPRYIKTAEDVLHSDLAVGAEDIGYNTDFFQYSENIAIKGIYDEKMAPNKKDHKRPFFEAEYGLNKVKKGGFGFQIDTATAYKYIEETFEENEICELQEIFLMEPISVAIVVALHSPFKKMVTYGLRQVIEHGTAHRLSTVWDQRRPECPESHSTTSVPVGIEEFSPAILLLIFGCGFSLFVMLVECLTIRCEKRRAMKRARALRCKGILKKTRLVKPCKILYPNEFA